MIFLTLAITGICTYYGTKLKPVEDITKFIPGGEKVNNLGEIISELKVKDKLVITLYNADSTDNGTQSLKESADTLAHYIHARFGKSYLKELKYKISDENTAVLYKTLYNNLPVFLEEKDYEQIAGYLLPDSIKQTLTNDYKTILSPGGIVLGKFIKNDPLNLVPIALKKLKSLQYDENFDLNDGYIMTRDSKNLMMFVTPSVKPSDFAANRSFINFLDSISGTLLPTNKTVIEYYGAPAVSVGNSEQIKKDTQYTSILALILISLMLVFYFRRVLVIVYILLPVAFGAVFSLALVYFLKTEISAIALGAGSIILGIAINYSLHIFTHYEHERSVKVVLKDLTVPMLIGCVTTVGSFFGLQFAKSEALHDFGLFSGGCLIGSVLFSLVVLPHLLPKKPGGEPSRAKKVSAIEKLASLRPDKNKALVGISLLFTVIFFYTSRKVSFENDMMKMNYQSEKLQKAQEHMDAVNKFSMQSVYVMAEGKDLNEALKRNEIIENKLQHLKDSKEISKYSSPAVLLISDSLQKIRIARWNNFWAGRKDSAIMYVKKFAAELKFKEDAFSGFYYLLDKKYKPAIASVNDTLSALVNDLINEKKDKSTVLTMVKVPADEKQKVYNSFAGQTRILVFDKQLLTEKYVSLISSDFNLILIFTGLLVFIFMLLSHGRIELAVINFLPMFVSWIWILGIMGLLGIKFNIVNIIISTFIFGLGDDYSIFIMDGLSHEYKYGKKSLDSYKASIFLSALTTIIGLGVLAFARHPALRSIAAITITGMISVVFISFIVQPLLYNVMILNRKKKGLPPLTFKNLIIPWTGFVIFICGGITILTIGAFLKYLFPAPKATRKLLFHKFLMYNCRFIIYFFVNVKKTIVNPQKEDFKKPSIIICNHQSMIDLAFLLTLSPKTIIFTNDRVWNSPFFGGIVRLADFYSASNGYEEAIGKVEQKLKEGYSVIIFPEGTRTDTGEILRFHKGAFYLAEKLQVDIIPMLLHGADNCLPKGDFYYREGHLRLDILPRIKHDDITYGKTYSERTKKICGMMRQKYDEIRQEVETTDYFRPSVVHNYIYKGPVLEWYCRIKMSMENNYKLFESLIPKKGKITDVGCGYGFLSLMLDKMSREREITGIDYDDEKISIADNCHGKTKKINFIKADITEYEFEKSDAFIINDVLHYLLPDQQINVLEKCIAKLNDKGTLIIRDGDASKTEKHKFTRLTEFFSVNSGFNKAIEDGLHFFSSETVKNTLSKYPGLSFEIINNDKVTSNVIFVVRKNA
ncbi:MAG: 1-acyl-sn-glycerol-3-phosphate acyltransferase [Bacteroidia bacterium]